MLKPGLAWKVGNVKNVEFRPGFLGRQGVLSDYLLHFAVPKSKSSSFAAWYLYSTHFILVSPIMQMNTELQELQPSCRF